MPEARHKKAMEDGWITQKQYAKLPPKLLDGIVKSKKASGTRTKEWSEKKGNKRKGQLPGSRLAFDDTKQEKTKMKKGRKGKK
jgi:hypothetical protein